jgi:two-component sensor histidine kinase
VHRARNDLAAVAAMLRLQAEADPDRPARDALLDAEGRVRALSRLNARLDAEPAGGIDSGDFLAGLAADFRSAHLAGRPIALHVRAEPCALPVAHARVLGLVINELLINAAKYAFPGDRGGAVSVVFECHGADRSLCVRDDGVGLDPAAPPRGTGVGRRMVRALAAQIGGTFQIGPGANGGTECMVRWRTAPSPIRRRSVPPERGGADPAR